MVLCLPLHPLQESLTTSSLQQKASEITFLSPTLFFKGLSFALFSSSHTLVAQWNRPGAFEISALFTYPEQWTESVVTGSVARFLSSGCFSFSR